MSGRSYYKPREAGSLKEAEAQLIAKCGGPGVAKARVGKTVLHQASDHAHPNRHLAVDVVADLERQAGEPIVTRYLAMAQNHICIPLPAGEAEPYPLVLARITTDTGALLSAGGESVRDGRVTPGEARLLKREALKVATALAALISDCDAVLAKANDERGAP
jgi:hypothetical protein